MTGGWSCSGSTNWTRQVDDKGETDGAGRVPHWQLNVPPGYHIRLDSELFTLRRDAGSMVGACAVGAAPSEVVRTAEVDYRATGAVA